MAAAPDDLVQCRRIGNVEVLTVGVREVYEAQVIERLGRAVRGVVRRSDAAVFVLDLSGVAFLTSGALGLIIHLHSQVRDQGRRFVLAGAGGEVARVVACTRLAEIMTVYATLEAALRDLGGEGDAGASG